MDKINEILASLAGTSNLRSIPRDTTSAVGLIDLSSNDYLGISENESLFQKFLEAADDMKPRGGSVASRLLASRQNEYFELENEIARSYKREALLFNSGYHANVGILQALGDKKTLFVADKLVHASMIDGMGLATVAGASFVRFRHNDFNHLKKIVETKGKDFDRVVIVAESVYSMDGDTTDIDSLVEARSMHRNAMIYLDEAHAVGVLGVAGLGLAASHPRYDKIDIVVGTLGKAFASMGAYVVTSSTMKDYLVNRCRSFIFSTAVPPLSTLWSLMTFRYSLTADTDRDKLKAVVRRLAEILPGAETPSHIQPLIIGTPTGAIEMAGKLREVGYKVLPIRTPTVPPGTDRLRFSLSAALNPEDLERLGDFFGTY